MPSIRIDLTPEQQQALKQFIARKGIANQSEYIRALIRADMGEWGDEFPADVEWGGKRHTQKEAQYRHNKQILFGDLLERLNDSIPVLVDDMTTFTNAHLTALIDDFEARDVVPDLLGVVREAQTILTNKGYIALMKWFGIVPLVDAETRQTITAKRILSADED